jgi:hypothetical protein
MVPLVCFTKHPVSRQDRKTLRKVGIFQRIFFVHGSSRQWEDLKLARAEYAAQILVNSALAFNSLPQRLHGSHHGEAAQQQDVLKKMERLHSMIGSGSQVRHI